MKILLAHNYYQEAGGEDQVFAAERDLLASFGHEVTCFTLHNDAIADMSRAAVLGATLWNRQAYRTLREQIHRERPAVVHFHNTFPLLSPAGYAAAHAEGAAVVQTLHNYRLVCPNALCLRAGKPCEKCLGQWLAWPGVVHGCYRHSRAATGIVAATTALHRLLGTWRYRVDTYVALTAFARRKCIAGGLPARRVIVKPNFVHPDPGVGDGHGGYLVFVGRLSSEKGVGTLLRAWELLRRPLPLKIVGDGPLVPAVRVAAAQGKGIEWLGRRPLSEVYDIVGAAAALVAPSECYETFGRAAIEAFAKGTPVIASDHGALAEVVAHGQTGWCFPPGDAERLARGVEELLGDRPRLAAMRVAAREQYARRYTGQANYEQLMAVYQEALARHGATDDRR